MSDTTATPAAPSTAVATARKDTVSMLPPEAQQEIALNRMRNAYATAIRGTQWGKELNAEGVRAVAEYARKNGLDPMRHIEVLGGKIYLTAECYEDRAAPLLQIGLVRKMEPEYINADPRLDAMVKAGDEWAQTEVIRRTKARIQYNVPENAKAVVVQRIYIRGVDEPIVGVNWCGGGSRQRDPVGDAEPAKTAASRAARRAWKQIVSILPPDAPDVFRGLSESAEDIEAMIARHDALLKTQITDAKPKAIAAPSDGGYGLSDELKDVETVMVDTETGDLFNEEDPFQ